LARRPAWWTADGGTVFVFGQATFAFATDDEVGRRLAAVQLVATEIASAVAVAAGFGIGLATLWRWKAAYNAGGVAGLIRAKPGPKRPTKLTAAVVARIRELDADGQTLTAIATTVGVDVATVRVALGRRRGSAGWEARQGAAGQPAGGPGDGGDDVSSPARRRRLRPGRGSGSRAGPRRRVTAGAAGARAAHQRAGAGPHRAAGRGAGGVHRG
jgi:transposase